MKKWKCLICNKEINYKGSCSESYIRSHIKRTHKMSYIHYLEKFYENDSENKEIEKCNFCKTRNAVPNLNINHDNKTFKYTYEDGYFCHTQECKNDISLNLLGKSYDEDFEHIGARVDYLCILHNKNKNDVNYKKSKGLRELQWTTSLQNYIKKFGEEEGIRRYKERGNKISYSNTKQYNIDKYGEELGLIKWEARIEKLVKNGNNQGTHSKAQDKIKMLLDNLKIKYEEEYIYTNERNYKGRTDFYLPNDNIIIEFYGDYWHCNPKRYNYDFFNTRKKQFAYEIWENDEKRIKYLHEKLFKIKPMILIIWEGSKINEEILFNLIEKNKSLKSIIYYD